MTRQLFPIGALLLGSAFLLFAGGIHALILPVRGAQEGFTAISLGLLGTGWAIGYILGCVVMPRMVGRVGHIRSFSVMCAFAAVSILMSLILVTPWAWIPLRAVAGFCFAGAAMIVESWLSDRSEPRSRGRIFGIYTMVNLVASTGGQMALMLGDTRTFLFFVLGAIFYCFALIPTAVSSTATPPPLVDVRIDLTGLWRNSPVAVFGVFCIGISNSAFGTLSAVYAERIGLALESIALFASIPILAGALAQIPIGMLSDRLDRRKVLAGTAVVAIAADLSFILLQPQGSLVNLILASGFGAVIFAMYPIVLAHANDHAPPGSAIQVSGGLLMVFGFGAIVGPLAAGFGMARIGVAGLFWTTVAAHTLLVAFTLWRMTRRGAVAARDKGAFVFAPPARTTTPETTALALGDSDAQPSEPDPGEAGRP